MSLAGCFFVSRKYCKLKLASYECCGGGGGGGGGGAK